MKVKIKTTIIDSLNENKKCNVIGEFDKDKKIVSYYDENILVHVIIGNDIIMQRNNDDYKLELIFEENKKHHSIYEIFNPKMEIALETDTIDMKRNENNFAVRYQLTLNGEDMGIFNLYFEMEE